MEKTIENIIKIILVILLLPFLVVYQSLSWGIVAEITYNLLIFHHFANLPILIWYDFAIIMLFLSILKPKSFDSIKDEYKDTTGSWIRLFIAPWISLLVIYIFYWCLGR